MEQPLKDLRIGYFGHYDPEFSRNRIIRKALCRAGARIVEMNCRSRGVLRYADLLRRSIGKRFDAIIVGFIGHTDVPLGRLIAGMQSVPLIFDAFISLYDSKVGDRGLVAPHGIAAHWLRFIDSTACRLSRLVLLDTETHIRYFTDTFHLSRRRFQRVWLGADDDVMVPGPKPEGASGFRVFFYGSYIPLQGIEHIIEAAKIVGIREAGIRFTILGSGQTYRQIRSLASRHGVRNVEFTGRVAYTELCGLMQRSDLCLGIFGSTPKAGRVIPNKVFDALATGRCVITSDTPAVRETLTHGENVWLCRPADAAALADSILILKNDPTLRERLAKNGYLHFKRHFSIDALSTDIAAVVQQVL